MAGSTETVAQDRCVDQVRLMARRTALLYHYFATTLVERLGKEEGRKLLSEAVWRYGQHIGEHVRQGVEAMGLPNDVENFGAVPDLPSVGWETETVETEAGPRLCVTHCPLAAVWKELGSEELGRLYCYVDQAKYRAYNPRAKLSHARNMLDGDPCCEFDLQLEDDLEL